MIHRKKCRTNIGPRAASFRTAAGLPSRRSSDRASDIGPCVGVPVEDCRHVITLDGLVELSPLSGRPPLPVEVKAFAIAVVLPDDHRFATADLLPQVVLQKRQCAQRIVPTPRPRMSVLERRLGVGGVGRAEIDADEMHTVPAPGVMQAVVRKTVDAMVVPKLPVSCQDSEAGGVFGSPS